jgi:hypothetical protein
VINTGRLEIPVPISESAVVGVRGLVHTRDIVKRIEFFDVRGMDTAGCDIAGAVTRGFLETRDPNNSAPITSIVIPWSYPLTVSGCDLVAQKGVTDVRGLILDDEGKAMNVATIFRDGINSNVTTVTVWAPRTMVAFVRLTFSSHGYTMGADFAPVPGHDNMRATFSLKSRCNNNNTGNPRGRQPQAAAPRSTAGPGCVPNRGIVSNRDIVPNTNLTRPTTQILSLSDCPSDGPNIVGGSASARRRGINRGASSHRGAKSAGHRRAEQDSFGVEPSFTRIKRVIFGGGKPDASSAKPPGVSSAKPDASGAKPGVSSAKPGVSSAKPDASGAKQDASGAKADAPNVKPGFRFKIHLSPPSAKPGAPSAKPDAEPRTITNGDKPRVGSHTHTHKKRSLSPSAEPRKRHKKRPSSKSREDISKAGPGTPSNSISSIIIIDLTMDDDDDDLVGNNKDSTNSERSKTLRMDCRLVVRVPQLDRPAAKRPCRLTDTPSPL